MSQFNGGISIKIPPAKQLCPINMNLFKKQKDPQKYIEKCFLEAKKTAQYDFGVDQITVKALYEILRIMGFFPNEFQLHEGFEYACFQSKYSKYLKNFTKPGIAEIQSDVKQQKLKSDVAMIAKDSKDGNTAKFDLTSYCEWLINNMRQLKYDPYFLNQNNSNNNNSKRSLKGNYFLNEDSGYNIRDKSFDFGSNNKSLQQQRSKRAVSTSNANYIQNNQITKAQQLFEDNKAKQQKQMQDQVNNLVNIFEKIDSLRKDKGLMPLDLSDSSSDEDDYNMTEEEKAQKNKMKKKQLIRNIPYDPDMHDLNQEISHLRNEAQNEIKSFIEKCKHNPQMRFRLEKSINKFQKDRIEANERIGKIGAVNAQKRITTTKKNQTQKELSDEEFIQKYETNLIRNLRIEYLMEKTDKPKMNFQQQIKPGSVLEKRLNKLIREKGNFY
ncbi:hypothetical protein ABPG72_001423 [Tetrahymena utriculariae]